MGHVIEQKAVMVVYSHNRGRGQQFLCQKEVRLLNFTENRDSQWLFLMGLWLIQTCQRHWWLSAVALKWPG